MAFFRQIACLNRVWKLACKTIFRRDESLLTGSKRASIRNEIDYQFSDKRLLLEKHWWGYYFSRLAQNLEDGMKTATGHRLSLDTLFRASKIIVNPSDSLNWLVEINTEVKHNSMNQKPQSELIQKIYENKENVKKMDKEITEYIKQVGKNRGKIRKEINNYFNRKRN